MSAPSASSVVKRIEQELRGVWATEDPNAPPKWRACTMNLVVVAPGVELADRYTPVVDEVTRGVPARAIVLALEPEAREDALEGSATAVCAVGEGAKTVCSERVGLVARGAMCGRVASVVEALTVPELPTTVVWLGRVHLDDPAFLSLVKDAHRLVLDTEYTSIAGLLQLARWSRAVPGRPHVADLAWTRLAVWQEMCARFFDAPRLRALAPYVTRVRIDQASDAGAPLGPEGALLLGWIATRLGWRTARLGGALRIQRGDGARVELDIGAVERPPQVAPASLAAVAIEAEHDGVVLRGTIERELATGLGKDTPDADVLVWRLDTEVPSATEQRVRLRANKGARLLERTLHRPAADPALIEAALFADTIVDAVPLV